MAVDLGIFQRQKTLLDQQDLQNAFQLKKQFALAQLQQQANAQQELQYQHGINDRNYALQLAALGIKQQQNAIVPMGQQPSIAPMLANPTSGLSLSNLTPLQHSQLMAESGGNPNAVSPAGAQGLMQLMPATAANPGFGVAPAKDNSPEENLRVGTEYQNALTSKYGGDQAKALIAYNWGPGNTDKWIAEGADPNKLPAETKAYVSKVFAGAGQPQVQQMPTQTTTNDVASADLATAKNSSPFASKGGQYITKGLPQGYALKMDGTAGPIPGTPAAEYGDENSTPSDLHGDDYLATLKPDIAAQVKALAEGRRPFPAGFAAKSPQVQQLMAAVSQYDPTFDAVNYNARAATRKDFTSGKSAQNITSFNTALGHLDTLSEAAKQLDNGNFTWLNTAANATESAFGDPRLNNFNAAKGAVADELEKAFRGSGGSVSGINEIKENINSSSSPAQLAATIRQYTELLKSRIDAVGEQYNKGMGTTKDPVELLTPKAQEAYNKITGLQQAFDNKKAASIPTFSDPSDPAFAKLPKGSKFIDSDGVQRVKH